MNASKCRNCGLVNTGADVNCRRCGLELVEDRRPAYVGPRDAARRFSLWPFVGLALVIGMLMYVYSGVDKENRAIQTREATRSAPVNREPAGLSRSEHDNRRAGQYKNAIQNAPALAEAQKRNEESRKLMRSQSNTER